jgi:hypothetical protein
MWTGMGLNLGLSGNRHQLTAWAMTWHKACQTSLCQEGGKMGMVPHHTSLSTVMRRIMTFQSTTDRIYDGGPIRLWYYNIIFFLEEPSCCVAVLTKTSFSQDIKTLSSLLSKCLKFYKYKQYGIPYCKNWTCHVHVLKCLPDNGYL